MKLRILLFMLFGLLASVLMVALATVQQSGGSGDMAEWLRAQRQNPVLWLLDGAALCIFIGTTMFGYLVDYFQSTNRQLRSQSKEYSKQMAVMIERTAELAKRNDEYAEQIAGLEDTLGTEARRLTE